MVGYGGIWGDMGGYGTNGARGPKGPIWARWSQRAPLAPYPPVSPHIPQYLPYPLILYSDHIYIYMYICISIIFRVPWISCIFQTRFRFYFFSRIPGSGYLVGISCGRSSTVYSKTINKL